MSVLDAPITMLIAPFRDASLSSRKRKEEPPSLLFINDVSNWIRGQKAMVTGHKSQMRWFRWGWVTVGRYMVVNDLKRETIN